jgi:hypothetical protein
MVLSFDQLINEKPQIYEDWDSSRSSLTSFALHGEQLNAVCQVLDTAWGWSIYFGRKANVLVAVKLPWRITILGIL